MPELKPPSRLDLQHTFHDRFHKLFGLTVFWKRLANFRKRNKPTWILLVLKRLHPLLLTQRPLLPGLSSLVPHTESLVHSPCTNRHTLNLSSLKNKIKNHAAILLNEFISKRDNCPRLHTEISSKRVIIIIFYVIQIFRPLYKTEQFVKQPREGSEESSGPDITTRHSPGICSTY